MGIGGAGTVRRPGVALILRAAALGVATGSRSSLAVSGPVLSGGLGPAVRTAAALAVVGELIGDKLPSTPSRLEAPILLGRIAAGGVGGALLARRADARTPAAVIAPVVAGLIGSAAGNFGGAAWRAWAARRGPDWVAAVIEDASALALTAWAAGFRRSARPSPSSR